MKTELHIRPETSEPFMCCKCGEIGLVASASNGHFYCRNCRDMLIISERATLGNTEFNKPHQCALDRNGNPTHLPGRSILRPLGTDKIYFG